MNENEINKLIVNIDNHIDKEALGLTMAMLKQTKVMIEFVNDDNQISARVAEPYRKLITKVLDACSDGLGMVLASIVIARKKDEPVGDVFMKISLSEMTERIKQLEKSDD